MNIFYVPNVRNRAYVIDLKGNKIYYGTLYQCRKFIAYMKDEPTVKTNKKGGKK